MPAPSATSATATARSRAGAGRPAESAATKKGMTPAMAVDAPPASARWSGSHAAVGTPGAPEASAAAAPAAATR
ncbi:MAG: hypothetical protein U0838_04460 [Chloroflexota bacterium]